jgi:hypothetical protein
MDWVQGEIDSQTMGAGSGQMLDCAWLCAAQLSDQFTDPTLMALRIWGSASNTSLTAPNSVFAVGLIAWSFIRAADGSAAIPTECPDLINLSAAVVCQDEDWIYWWYLPSAGNEPGGTIYYLNDGGDRISKARRRLGNNMGLLFVVQSAATFYNYHFHAAALIKE